MNSILVLPWPGCRIRRVPVRWRSWCVRLPHGVLCGRCAGSVRRTRVYGRFGPGCGSCVPGRPGRPGPWIPSLSVPRIPGPGRGAAGSPGFAVRHVEAKLGHLHRHRHRVEVPASRPPPGEIAGSSQVRGRSGSGPGPMLRGRSRTRGSKRAHPCPTLPMAQPCRQHPKAPAFQVILFRTGPALRVLPALQRRSAVQALPALQRGPAVQALPALPSFRAKHPRRARFPRAGR